MPDKIVGGSVGLAVLHERTRIAISSTIPIFFNIKLVSKRRQPGVMNLKLRTAQIAYKISATASRAYRRPVRSTHHSRLRREIILKKVRNLTEMKNNIYIYIYP
mgnify:CR=1 FL=1